MSNFCGVCDVGGAGLSVSLCQSILLKYRVIWSIRDIMGVSLSGLRILVADDEVELRTILKEELEYEGATVFVAENGLVAYEIARRENVDLIVSDVRMPGGSGIDLLDKIKANNIYQPVVLFITGYSDLALDESYAKGADAVFSKPFKISQIIEVIQKLSSPFSKRYAVPPSVEAKQVVVKIYHDLKQAILEQHLQIGRGGIFLQVEDAGKLDKTADCALNITFELGPVLDIQFTGLIRWTRGKDEADKRPGIGVEFKYLPPACQKILEAIILETDPVPSIPIGRRC